ncbi:MAG: DUF4105 domain-containing protein [Xanthomonadales bacterium]|nr:DUF4105 domain-containing protein [Xanthomonadales bacterium]
MGIAKAEQDIFAVPDDATEAWLVTFGPGGNYWERFGHNAIWLREPAKGLDHTFNFGYFDFEQEDFLFRFLRGRMLYFSIAQRAEREFEFYRQDNRSIRIQKLNLAPRQYRQLRDHLLDEIKPENRDYRYDYYLNNCSTRIRDALDLALDGVLSERTMTMPAQLNFRDHTRRLTQMQFWYYLGLEIGLGYPVDRPITRWDEMFIPMVVADEVAAMSRQTGGSLLPVDTMLFTASSAEPAAAPVSVWHRYLALGLAVVAITWLSGKFMPPVWLEGLCLAWLMISASIGMVLAGLWLFTDHAVTRPNTNLLLFNPVMLLALAPMLRRLGAALLAGGTAIAWILFLYPDHQYNLDVLLLATPINLAVAAYFWKTR